MDRLKNASPRFWNGSDAVVFGVHIAILEAGCTLYSLQERDEGKDALPDSAEGWNGTEESQKDVYVFVYKNGRGDGVLVKVIQMGSTLLVHALNKTTNNDCSIELPKSEYLSNEDDSTIKASQPDDIYKNLSGLFELVTQRLRDTAVIRDAAPPADSSGSRVPVDSAFRDPAFRDPSRPPGGLPGRPLPMDDDDDPLRVGPRRGGDFGGDLFPGPPGRGGSLLGPNDPAWGGRGLPGGLRDGGGGRAGGGIGRFDPVDPFGGGMPGRDGRFPGPDPDHLPMPGRRGGRGRRGGFGDPFGGGGLGGGGGFGFM